ncbi:MAG: hypothetical protein RMH84_03320, partial [Sulfolobales archaeon]|nr:hypothetical protein [Sulfolobales archaeon]
MSSRELLVRRLIAVAIYVVIAGVVALLVYPEVYLEVQVALLVSTALIALFGHKYPGLIPAFSVILVVVYLYVVYVLRGVVYVLLYAEIAMLSLTLTLVVPLYVLVTKLRKLDDAITACYYLITYMLSISWVSSLSTSLALLTGLSTLFSSVVAAASLTTYSLLLLLTTYAAQFSATELSSLRAIPIEFLEVGRDSLAYEVFLKYSVALLAYFLGFLVTRSAYRVRPLQDKRTARGVLLDALRRLAIAVPIALVSAYVFKAEVPVLVQTSVLVPLFVLSLSVVRNYAENIAEAHSYVLDSRELIEILKRKISHLEEVASYFREGELESLKDLREFIEYSKLVVQRSSEAISSTIT